MGLINVADLDARQVEYVDNAQALAAIEDASAVARVCVSPILDDVDRGGTPEVPGAVVAVVVGMVRRVLSNPRGLQAETLGDYTYAAGTNAVATLYPTTRERRLLRSAAKKFAADAGLSAPAWGAGSASLQSELPAPWSAYQGFALPSDS